MSLEQKEIISSFFYSFINANSAIIVQVKKEDYADSKKVKMHNKAVEKLSKNIKHKKSLHLKAFLF